MKKLFLLIAISFCIFGTALSYDNVKTRINITTRNGHFLNNRLIFGIDKDATVNRDTALGEWEVPPPPPEGVLAGFRIFDTDQTNNVYAFVDLRPYPTVEMQADTHYLKVWVGTGDLITFKWSPLGPEIESCRIVDALTLGTLVDINMKDSSSALISNEFIESFLIYVVYNPYSSVKYENDNSDINIYPQPASEYIKIYSGTEFQSFEISDLRGNIIEFGELISDRTIRTEFLSSGFYLLRLIDDTGNFYIKKFLKY